MEEVLLKKIEFEKFVTLLKEMLDQGMGEIQYRVVVKNNKVEYIALTKTNTYKSLNDMI